MKQANHLGACMVLLIFASMLILSACGSGGGAGGSDIGKISYAPENCEIDGQNRFVHKVMLDTYYWYKEVPTSLDYSSFSSPEEVLDFVRYYPEKDRFSYITTTEQFQGFFEEGKFIGLGASFLILTDGRLITRFVFPDSPAARAGVARGDEILTINGKTIKEITDGLLWDSIFGEDKEGVAVELEVKFRDATIKTIELVKEIVTIKTILHREVIERNGVKVGYFVFNAFIGPSAAELETLFADFKTAGVTELVLDLRYNGGGLVSIARTLASYIYGNNSGSEIFVNFNHNDRYQHWAWNYHFSPALPDRLNLQRIFVLTQPGTCSASELVINGLKPFIEVVQIGQKTCGKPVGVYGHEFCGKRIQAIEFETTNHNNNGGYFDGIQPDCSALDDPTQLFGAADENLLATTLGYIDNGVCPSVSVASRRALQQQQETVLPELYQGFRREIGAF